MTTTLSARFRALPAAPIEDALRPDRGTLADYAQLARHHYRAARPATATRVLVLRLDEPTVVGRWLGRHGESQVVAALVESMPPLACKLRDHALPGRYGPPLSPRQSAGLLNAEVRCVSRVVVDPRWRGLGLAVRLVRAALAQPTTPYTEALAAMGHVHPFFEHAGMTRYERPPHPHDARLEAALAMHGLRRGLVSAARTRRAIDALPAASRDLVLRELHRWFRSTFGRGGGTVSCDAGDHLRAARERLLCRPVYYLHHHLEEGR